MLPPDRFARLATIETNHFWFIARRRLVFERIERWIPKTSGMIADLGCGTGLMVTELCRRQRPTIGFDSVGGGFDGNLLARGRRGQADLHRLPIQNGVLGAALLLDVLEHVDDSATLAEVHRALRPGGILIATVPALPALWSVRDDDARHLRRYTKQGLKRLLDQSGFEVLELTFYQCLLLPVVILSRWIGRHDRRWRDTEETPSPLVNALFARVNAWELRLGRLVRWPVGSSLVVIAAKNP